MVASSPILKMAAKFFDFLYNTVCRLCLDTAEILRKHWLSSRGSGSIMSHPACHCCALFQNSQRTEIKGKNRIITPSCTSVSFWKILLFNVKPTVRNIFCIHSSRVDHYAGGRRRVVLKKTKLFYYLYLHEGYDVRLKLMRWSDQACSLKRLPSARRSQTDGQVPPHAITWWIVVSINGEAKTDG